MGLSPKHRLRLRRNATRQPSAPTSAPTQTSAAAPAPDAAPTPPVAPRGTQRQKRPLPQRTSPKRTGDGLFREDAASGVPAAATATTANTAVVDPQTPVEEGVHAAYRVFDRYLEEGRAFAEGQSAWYQNDTGQPELTRDVARAFAEALGIIGRLARQAGIPTDGGLPKVADLASMLAAQAPTATTPAMPDLSKLNGMAGAAGLGDLASQAGPLTDGGAVTERLFHPQQHPAYGTAADRTAAARTAPHRNAPHRNALHTDGDGEDEWEPLPNEELMRVAASAGDVTHHTTADSAGANGAPSLQPTDKTTEKPTPILSEDEAQRAIAATPDLARAAAQTVANLVADTAGSPASEFSMDQLEPLDPDDLITRPPQTG